MSLFNKTKQTKTKSQISLSFPLFLPLVSLPLSSKANTVGLINLNSNFICTQRSPPVLQLFQKMLIICVVSPRVSPFYSYKLIFNISSLSVWQDLRPYHFLLSVHYSILKNILTLNPQQLFAASVKPQFSCVHFKLAKGCSV